ncbi:MAG: hypothetical protein KGO53_05810 [Alphaproteobacteria bacterium]|nr:hypothetical protein [Alphaproteobacteria bacterium]
MKLIPAILASALALSIPALAQEKEDVAESFARVKGASVYDFKMGVDGTLVSEEYMLTHVTCTDGSRTLRVLLPLGAEDNDMTFSMDGPKSTLKKSGSGYTADFKANGKTLNKAVAVKPVKDPKSHYHQQFEITLDVGGDLWKAMRDAEPGKAVMLIGTGGTPVDLPDTPKFTEFLKSCGITP